MLALVVALLNSSGGLEALYVFLTAVAFSMFLIFIIAPLYRRLCIYTNSFERGPSPLLMFVTLLIVLLSAFVTDIIGKEIAVFVYWQYSNNITIDRAIFFFIGIAQVFTRFLVDSLQVSLCLMIKI